MKTLKRSGVKIEANAAKKLHEMNSKLKDLFSIVKLGEIVGGLILFTLFYILVSIPMV